MWTVQVIVWNGGSCSRKFRFAVAESVVMARTLVWLAVSMKQVRFCGLGRVLALSLLPQRFGPHQAGYRRRHDRTADDEG